MTEDKGGTLREHEKFWAFIILVGAIIGLVLFSSFGLDSKSETPATDVVFAAKLRIIDVAVAGLLTIAGMAAQALFRVSSVDKLSAETALEAARKLPEPVHAPQPVEVVNPPSNPVPTTDGGDSALPDYAR